MPKKILILIITSLLIVGCNDKSKQNSADKQSEAAEQTDPASSHLKRNKSTDDIEQVYAQAEKANLWLSIFNNQIMDVVNKLDIRIYSSDLNYIDSKAKKVLDLCGEKNNKCNLQTIQKDPDLYLKIMSSHERIDDKEINNYNTLIEKLIKLQPQLSELDAAGKVYTERYSKLALSLNKLYDYYYNNEYKLDDCKKGPELLNNIINAYGEFISAKMAASAAYNKFYKETHDIQKLDIKNQGLTFKYNCIDMMDSINEVVTLINEKSEEKNQFKNLDKAAVEQKIQQIEAIANQLMTIKGKDEEIKKQALNDIYYDRFVDYLPQMINQMKIILKKLHDKDIYQEIDRLNDKEKSLIEKYNDVIN